LGAIVGKKIKPWLGQGPTTFDAGFVGAWGLFRGAAAGLYAGTGRRKESSGRAYYGEHGGGIFGGAQAAGLGVQLEGDRKKESDAER
jgi:hypothetical protein